MYTYALHSPIFNLRIVWQYMYVRTYVCICIIDIYVTFVGHFQNC